MEQWNRGLLNLLGLRPADTPPAQAWAVKGARWGEQLTKEDMYAVGAICPHRPYRRGDHVFRKGDPAAHLFVLLEGHVKLSTPSWLGANRIIHVCGPDDFFGENFLTKAECCAADAQVVSEQALICPISYEQFMTVAREVPRAVLAFAAALAHRNAELESKLGVMNQPVQARLAHVMIELARRLGTPQEDGWHHLHVDLRHDELASLAGANRVSATHALSMWRKRQLVSGTRGHYQVDVPGLERLLENLEVEALK